MTHDRSYAKPLKDSPLKKPSDEHATGEAIAEGISFDANQSSAADSLSISESQLRLSLYFTLCAKRHSLFRQAFIMHNRPSKPAKQATHRHVPILVRRLRPSSELLDIISDAPEGSEDLLLQARHFYAGIISRHQS